MGLLDGKVAVVTGAGRGIGRGEAIELARCGARVVVNELDADAGRQVVEEIAAAGGEAVLDTGDCSEEETAEHLIATALSTWGRLDALVNNAGYAPLRPIREMSVEQWRAVIDTNLSAAFYATRAAWPAFERQGGGVVVNVSSVSARDPFVGFAAYGAAKAGLNLFGLAAAREGERIGVRVHTVAPAAVETGMFRGLVPPDRWPAEKTLDPADVAKVIAQCVRGELRYASGEVIYLHKTVG